jgi:hypothetical protein
MFAKKKRNEEGLHQIPLLHLREETAQKKGKKGGHFPIGILQELRLWEQRYRAVDGRTIGMLQDIGPVQEQLYPDRKYVQEQESAIGQGSRTLSRANSEASLQFWEMIGKGKSIAHTGQSMGYGWNQEKGAEVVHSQNLAGETAKQVTEEFKLVQEMNPRCQKNTLSFVLSPTKEDGKDLSNKELGELTKSFIEKMQLQDRQAIAFVHRDKAHTHVHLYTNRIGFDGKAYKDSFIGKRSQQMAEQVAMEKGLTTVKMVQIEKEMETFNIRQGIKRIHEQVMDKERPKTLLDYMRAMGERKVQVIPSINKAGKLQGFRFEHKGHNFKGSEVHRSMSGGNLTKQLAHGMALNKQLESAKGLAMVGKAAELVSNASLKLIRKTLEQAAKRAMDSGMGY